MSAPLVSVVITTFNGKDKRLNQAIESVLHQTYKNIEVIIVNDASTNNVENVILSYCKTFDNIKYLKNEKNSERCYSRNRGIFESKGKYIAFLDDDDVWADENKLKKQIFFLESNTGYVMCGTSFLNIDKDGCCIGKIKVQESNIKIRKSFLLSNQFALSSVVIRKDVLLFSGFFNPDFNKVEDYDLWLRIGKYGSFGNIVDSYILYRTWQGNTTTTSNFLMRKLGLSLIYKNKQYYPNFYKALFFRIGGLLIPQTVKLFISKYFKL